MNVLIISQYYPPDIGGGSTRVFNAAVGLRKQGCDVKIITAFPHYPHGQVSSILKRKALKIEETHGIKLMRVWIPSLPHDSVLHRIILHFSFAVSSMFAAPFVGRVDIVWAANPNLFSFFPALAYSFVKRKRIVRNVDDLWPEVFYDLGLVKSKLLKRLLDVLAWLSYTVPAAITPISPGYIRQIAEKYGVNRNKIHVIEVGVYADSAHSTPPSQSAKDNFVLMYSGSLGVGYDFETVLRAAHSLLDFKDIGFVIRGMGECEHEIRRMVRRFGLSNVRVETGHLSRPELISVLSSADAFLLPMKRANAIDGGLPTKIFEYQAFGKPIICSSRGESAAYVNSAKSGLVVDPGNSEGLAAAILQLYRDRKLAWELGANGYRSVHQNLTSDRIGERLCAVFVSAMPSHIDAKRPTPEESRVI